MTLDSLIFLAIGMTVNGLTFALGIAVGVSLRKDSDHDSDDDSSAYEAEIERWHKPVDSQR